MLNKIERKLRSTVVDKYLLSAILIILLLGLIMLSSVSTVISSQLDLPPFYFFWRQVVHILLGSLSFFIVLHIKTSFWFRQTPYILIISLILLIAVLIPGIGKEINGSYRWIDLGPINIQVAEIVKFTIILYLASYLSRNYHEIQKKIITIIKPLLIIALSFVLLMLEPDFGSSVIILLISIIMIFLAGARIFHLLILISISSIVIFSLSFSQPYRIERLLSFLDPWQYPLDSGYQLTQSLIAIGQGGILGVGLGESIQKLFYLPEAHTDFIFAIVCEELGLLGAIILIGCYLLITWRGFLIAKRAHLGDKIFLAMIAYGISIWIFCQTFINIGVNIGILPTKGLTLPFFSYGGSSIIVLAIAYALLFRINFETLQKKQLTILNL